MTYEEALDVLSEDFCESCEHVGYCGWNCAFGDVPYGFAHDAIEVAKKALAEIIELRNQQG